MNSTLNIEDYLDQLDCAESFFDLLEIPYDPKILVHKRIHLLRLFYQELESRTDTPVWADYRVSLKKAYLKIQQGDLADLSTHDCGTCQQCEEPD